MKKIISIILLISLLFSLSACKNQVKSDNKINKEFKLVVQSDLLKRAKDTAEFFSKSVNDISNGNIIINIEESDDILESLSNGADFVMANNAQIARANGDFNIFTSPFFFSSKQDCTMTLNSDTFKKLISSKTESLVKAKPLLAMYDGQRCFVSNNNEISTVGNIDSWTDIEIAIDDENEELSMMFENLGCYINSYGYENNIKLFRNSAVSFIECDYSNIQSLPSSLLPQSALTIYNSCHYIYINWIMQNIALNEKLSEDDRAVIEDALAMTTSFSESKINQLENNSKLMIKRFSILSINFNRDDYQKLLINLMQENIRYKNLWDWNLYYSINDIIE